MKPSALTAEATDLLPKLLWHLDEPLADATIIPTYLLSQATRRRVTVALSGEGGDELFGGYTHYQGMQAQPLAEPAAPRGAPGSGRRPPAICPPSGSPRLGYLGHRLERIAATSLFPLFEGYTRKVAFFTPEEQQRLFSPDFRARPTTSLIWSTSGPFPGPIRSSIPSPRPIWPTSRSFCRTACWSRWTA